jgi:hypothetical protein
MQEVVVALLRFKRADPIDRAISDLDQQIAAVQRQLREVSNGSAQAGQNRGPSAGATPQSPAQTFTRFIKDMLVPPGRAASPTYHSREDLFDGGAEPLKELEAEPIAFARKPEPDLFANSAPAGSSASTTTTALETAQVVPPQEKLAHYLGAGSIKSYKPLRRVQRQTRNRFFMWLGLSLFALWIIWFVIR